MNSPAERDADSDGRDLESVEAELVEQVGQRVERMIMARFHRGPLPDPQVLAQYDQVMPGLANRIVSMAERQQAHAHHVQRAEVEEPFKLAKRGQWFALAAIVLVLIFASWLVLRGHYITGGIIAGLDLATLAAAFVTGQFPDRSEDDQDGDSDEQHEENRISRDGRSADAGR